MEYVNLGNTGVRVSRICLGMMSFGNDSDRPWALAEDAAEPIVKAAAEGCITFYDTADTYSKGASEVATGRLLRKLPGWIRDGFCRLLTAGTPSLPVADPATLPALQGVPAGRIISWALLRAVPKRRSRRSRDEPGLPRDKCLGASSETAGEKFRVARRSRARFLSFSAKQFERFVADPTSEPSRRALNRPPE
jgi:hypothetical protein